MKVAVLADIHGNSWALDAVLADAERSGASSFVDLGDCLFGPLDPRGTADRLLELGATTVRGNGDRAVLEDEQSPSAVYTRSTLERAHLEWLSALPSVQTLDGGILACHGSPTDDTSYLLEEVRPRGARHRHPADVDELLSSVEASIVLCGHTHVPRLVPLPSGKVVVNPGSVGYPAYSEERPYPHVMESGSPHARYALLTAAGGTYDVELRAISYDWEAAAAAARDRGRADWEYALATGLAQPV